MNVLLKVKCGYKYSDKFTPFLYIDGTRCHNAQAASQDTFLRRTRLVCKEISIFLPLQIPTLTLSSPILLPVVIETQA